MRLFALGECLDDADLLACTGFRETLLVETPFVVCDQAVCGGDYRLGGAVVLLQPEFPGFGIVPLEAEDVLDAGSAESVDALGVVSNHADVVVRFRQAAQDHVLCMVGVLVLVHKDVAETGRDGTACLREPCKEYVHLEQDVIEIHGPGGKTFFLIQFINVRNRRFPGGPVPLGGYGVSPVSGHGDQAVLGHGDYALDHCGLVVLVIQLQFLDALLYHAA